MTCPVCGQDDQHFLRCFYAGCPDGRHTPKYRKSPLGAPPAKVPPEEELPVNAEGPMLDGGAAIFTASNIYPPEAAPPGAELPWRLIATVTGIGLVVWGFALYGVWVAAGKFFGW